MTTGLLRATLSSSEVAIAPGRPARVSVEVTNASEVIDGVMATLLPEAPRPSGSRGTDGSGEFGWAVAAGDAVVDPGVSVRAEPALLPLFPDGSGTLTLEVAVSPTYPAGRHHLWVRLTSSVRPDEDLRAPLTLDVEAVPAATITAAPAVRSARHKVRYSVITENRGNTRLDLDLAASDPERVANARFHPAVAQVLPGEDTSSRLEVRARRHLLGSDIAHRLMVVGTSADLEVHTQATFRQRPLIPRGLRTVLVLAVIIGLWAAVFIVGLNKALATDPLTKEVPPSFYAAVSASKAGASASAASDGQEGRRLALQTAADSGSTAAPAGAVPKTGVVVGVGGTVAGTVTAASTGDGIGRISVEAVSDSPSGPQLVSSAASASDGSYALVGLLPGQYKLLFTAQGYSDVWYPDATTEAAGKPVTVNAMAQTSGIDTVIKGAPATISGTVQTGQTPAPPVTVTVVGAQGSTKPIATVTANAQGNYTIPNLPAPGSYDLSFSSSGYQVGTDTEVVSGGEQEVANTVTLTAAAGSIAGTVTDGTSPLGGVTITASANGQTLTSATPTTGEVGQFSLGNLATPATYLLTFSDSGYGTQTVAEHLGAGQALTNVAITMVGGAGQVSGKVSDPTGAALGGVTVSVAGGAKPITTQTLTAGAVGTYELSGLTTPGSYTVTFSMTGYTSQTVPVTLASSGSAAGVDATLPVGTAGITGTVTSSAGSPLTGVKVSVTDGQGIQTTTSSSSPPGGYALSGLAPGTYSVTFSASGYGNVTALVPVTAGQTATQSVVLTPTS